MALIYQLDFFRSEKEAHFEALERLIEAYKESNDRVRKGCFAKLNELAKENRDLKERLDILERNICRQSVPFELPAHGTLLQV